MIVSVEGNMWSMSLDLYDIIIIFVLIIYWSFSTNILYYIYLDNLKTNDNKFNNLFKSNRSIKVAHYIMSLFGFISMIPPIKSYVIGVIDNKYDEYLLRFYSESIYHNMEGLYGVELEELKKSMKLKKRKVVLNKLNNKIKKKKRRNKFYNILKFNYTNKNVN